MQEPITEVQTLDEALALEAGATCLERTRLIAATRFYLGDDEVDARISVRVSGSTTDGQQLSFGLWIDGQLAAERFFQPAPDDCTELHAVVGLAIAIALDETLPAELGIIEEADDGEDAEQVSGDAIDYPSFEDELPPPKRPGPALGITAAGAAFVGVAPQLGGGGLLLFDIRPRPHFDLRLGAFATHVPSFALDVGDVGITMAAGRIDLCWGTKPRRVRGRVCLGGAAGATIAQGRGYTENFQRTIPYFAGLASTDMTVRIAGPLALELRVDCVIPFQKTILDVRSTGGQLLARAVFDPVGAIVAVGPRFEF